MSWMAAATMAAPVIMGMMNKSGQADANTANKNMSREQMAFQKEMSSTAHQRQVKDMKAAGLNPILSVNSGASAPSGSMATAQNENEGLARGVENAVSTAMQQKRLSQDIKNLKAAETQTIAMTKKTNTENTLLKAKKPSAEIQNDLGRRFQDLLKHFSSTSTGAKDSVRSNSKMREAMQRGLKKSSQKEKKRYKKKAEWLKKADKHFKMRNQLN